MTDTNDVSGRPDPPRAGGGDGQPESPPSVARSRSPIERAVVWTLIGVLLVVLGIELAAFGRYRFALWELSHALEAAADDPEGLTAAKVGEVLGGKKFVEASQLSYMEMLATRVEVYEWSGLLRDRRLYVYYGGGRNPEVVSILSHPKERVLGTLRMSESTGAETVEPESVEP